MSRCSSCRASIVWVRTPAGRKMPCDPEHQSWEDGTVVDDAGNVTTGGALGYRPHWASCPNAKRHRSPQRGLFSDTQRGAK